MARSVLLTVSLLALAAGAAAAQDATTTGGAGAAARTSATLGEGCATLLQGGGGNGTGGTTTDNTAVTGANATFPDCMTPSTLRVAEGTRAVLLTLTNDGAEDLCIDVRLGDTSVSDAPTGGTGGGAGGEDIPGTSPCADNTTADGDGSGGTAGSTGGTSATACVAPAGGGTAGSVGGSAGGANGTGGLANGSTGGTGGGANGTGGGTAGNGTPLPVLVRSGESLDVCVPMNGATTLNVVLADADVAIGQVMAGSVEQGGTGQTGGTGGTGGAQESTGDGDETPMPVLVVLFGAGLAALVLRRRA